MQKQLGFTCACLLLVGVLGRFAVAQGTATADAYGRGVHQYFAGNLDRAVGDLSAAINAGSKDPRAFYFRALAEQKMGWTGNAMADFQMGAQLEVGDSNQYFPVAKSLERVQGSARATLEKYRSQARADALAQQQQRNLVRYDEPALGGGNVVRGPVIITPAPAPTRTLTPAPSLAPRQPSAGAPLARPTSPVRPPVSAPVLTPPPVQPGRDVVAPSVPETLDPFAPSSTPAAAPPADPFAPSAIPPATAPVNVPQEDPFGEPPTRGSAPPAAPPAAPPGGNPFGDD